MWFEPRIWPLEPVDDLRAALLSNEVEVVSRDVPDVSDSISLLQNFAVIASLLDRLRYAGCTTTTHALLCECCRALYVSLRLDSSLASLVEDYVAQTVEVLGEEITEADQLRSLRINVDCITASADLLDSCFYESVCAQLAQHATKLLRRQTQCQALLVCAHLFNDNVHRRDPERVVECLQRALRIADVSFQSNVAAAFLYVEVLEAYVAFFEAGIQLITAEHLVNLAQLTKKNLQVALKKTAVAGNAKRDSVQNCWSHFQAYMQELGGREATRGVANAIV